MAKSSKKELQKKVKMNHKVAKMKKGQNVINYYYSYYFTF